MEKIQQLKIKARALFEKVNSTGTAKDFNDYLEALRELESNGIGAERVAELVFKKLPGRESGFAVRVNNRG